MLRTMAAKLEEGGERFSNQTPTLNSRRAVRYTSIKVGKNVLVFDTHQLEPD